MLKNHSKITFLVFFVCLLSQNSRSAVTSNENPSDSKKLNQQMMQKVFSVDDSEPPMNFQETLDLLEQLSGFGLQSEDELSKIDSLIEASIVDDDKCTEESLSELNDLIEDIVADIDDPDSNSQRYLVECRERLFSFCDPIFSSDLRGAIGRLSKQDKKDAELLFQSIINRNKEGDEEEGEELRIQAFDIDFIPKKERSKGIIDFLALRDGSKLNSSRGSPSKEELNQEFEIHVRQMCSRVAEQLREPYLLYQSIIEVEELANQVGEYEMRWTKIGSVCDFMSSKTAFDANKL